MLEALTLALISLLGAMSPGPDFAIVTRHALTGSRKAAMLATFGIASAVLIHVTYCTLGVVILLQESPLLFRILQISGSCYLAYLGIKLLLASSKKNKAIAPPPLRKAFTSGFVSNLLNPKATLSILSIYTQFVGPETSFTIQVIYGLIIASTALIWFSIVSFLITHPLFQPSFAKFQKGLMKGMGVILILLAGTVLYTVL